jgi:hypothetical protein
MKILEDKALAIVFLLISIILLFENNRIESVSYDLLGPKFFPMIICIAIILLSVFLFFKAENLNIEKNKNRKKEVNYKKILLFLFLSLFYILSLGNISFVICTTIYLFILILILSNFNFKEILKYLFISLLFAYGVYYFFEKYLQLILP